MENIKSSVIIPVYARRETLERAVSSIIAQPGSEFVEIVIVDDCSPNPFRPANLRMQDKFILLEENRGPANARNVGLDVASGRVIYFLDSDDYFIYRNFELDYYLVAGSNSLFYCDYVSGNYRSNFPEFISDNDYFRSIFYQYHGICNTCTMVFDSNLNVRFDSTLPKHEDWDFVFFNFIRRQRSIVKIDGLSYIDRGDKRSLSRKPDITKELPWLSKLERVLSKEIYGYVEFCILAKYKTRVDWARFITNSILYFRMNHIGFNFIFKRIIQRLIVV